jgi:predicted RNA-binding Zn-ribbon protein involved in translation (DUF1610 family)
VTTETLEQWAARKDRELPRMCVGCGKELKQIRFAQDMDRLSIHLTGAGVEREWYIAECPHCGKELARKLTKHR